VRSKVRIAASQFNYFRLSPSLLQVINEKNTVSARDFENLLIDLLEIKGILEDMVRNNILYFDPTEAVYYPQGKRKGRGRGQSKKFFLFL
jgi:hypothetical protein